MSAQKSLVSLPAASATRTHPAYSAVFEAYAASAKSITRALRLVGGWWDEETLGPLPDRRTVTRWVAEDGWDATLGEAVVAHRRALRQKINEELLLAGPAMVRVLVEIALDEEADPKIGSVRQASAYKVLQLASAGVLETRYGDLPESDEGVVEAIAQIRQLSPDALMRQQAALLAEDDEE